MPSTISPREQRWPRGPWNELHDAAFRGSTERTIAVLSRGSINIDQGDLKGSTPLMFAAQEGRLHLTKILLNRGANASIAVDGGITALHFSSQEGHLAVTVDLIKAGADLEARTTDGATPLHIAAQKGRSEVMAALVEAGADVDSVSRNGRTALFVAAGEGHVDIVRELLRAKANPLLSRTITPGETRVPLDAAAEAGHSKVVRELTMQRGIQGCAGASGGVDALCVAAENQHVNIMVMLTDAGVVDTGLALISAAGWGGETAVKFLLQQRQLAGSPAGVVAYVNFCDRFGRTALLGSINFWKATGGGVNLISPRVVQLLLEAGQIRRQLFDSRMQARRWLTSTNASVTRKYMD